MSQADLSRRLNQAIELVNAGRRAEARDILVPLSQQYPNVEQIWMWLATASDNTEERIKYLQRVLQINPRSERARVAYTRLTGAPPSGTQPAPRVTAPSSRTIESILIALLGVVALIVVILVISTVVAPALRPKPTATATDTPTITYTPSMTFTASYTPGGPTITPIGFQTLPPSWTPSLTLTPQPTRTPRPTSTPTATYTPSLSFKDRPSLTPVPTITPGGPTFTPVDTDTPIPSVVATVDTRTPQGLPTFTLTYTPGVPSPTPTATGPTSTPTLTLTPTQ